MGTVRHHTNGLREKLDKIENYFKTTAQEEELQDPMLIMMSDHIEGFFTNVDVEAAIEAHERIIQLYLAQFANKKKVGKRRFQATSRNSKKIFVPIAKTSKPGPGWCNVTKFPGKYSTIQLKELTKIIRWATQYRTFTLGTLVLKQKSGVGTENVDFLFR